MLTLMRDVSTVLSPENLSVPLALLVVLFAFRRKWEAAAITILAAAGNGLTPVLKHLIAKPRPLDGLVSESGYSFPSGHALGVTIFAASIWYLLWRRGWRRSRLAIVTMPLVGLVVLVSYSRVYLRVHWISDVIGGALIGLLWVWFVAAIAPKLIAFSARPPLRG